MSLTVHAPAKINLTLDVTGRRADGYHTLTSIFQTVSRYDTVTLTKTTAGVTLETPGGAPCPPEKNTVYRAAQTFFAHTGIAGGVALTLTKRIPQQAGMGGGSADGAAVLAGLDRLYDTHLSPETLPVIWLANGAKAAISRRIAATPGSASAGSNTFTICSHSAAGSFSRSAASAAG